MIKLLKAWLKKYDTWCHSMGLTPEQKRCCVAYRTENSDNSSDNVR
ncbi:hypothetical protein ACXJY6_09610 [Vibrio sp. RC27]